ncbi:hypothetical protein ACVWWG_006407 [Bradyrhizobium sp. LB7.2]
MVYVPSPELTVRKWTQWGCRRFFCEWTASRGGVP